MVKLSRHMTSEVKNEWCSHQGKAIWVLGTQIYPTWEEKKCLSEQRVIDLIPRAVLRDGRISTLLLLFHSLWFCTYI